MKAEIEILPYWAYFIDELRGGGRDAIITAPTQLLKMQLIFTPPYGVNFVLPNNIPPGSCQKTHLSKIRKAENATILELHCRMFVFLKNFIKNFIKNFRFRTHIYVQGGKKYLGTAFPDI